MLDEPRGWVFFVPNRGVPEVQPHQIGGIRTGSNEPWNALWQLFYQPVAGLAQVVHFFFQVGDAVAVCGFSGDDAQGAHAVLGNVRQAVPDFYVLVIGEDNLRALEASEVPCLGRCGHRHGHARCGP